MMKMVEYRLQFGEVRSNLEGFSLLPSDLFDLFVRPTPDQNEMDKRGHRDRFRYVHPYSKPMEKTQYRLYRPILILLVVDSHSLVRPHQSQKSVRRSRRIHPRYSGQ